jgi:hypothetical protein
VCVCGGGFVCFVCGGCLGVRACVFVCVCVCNMNSIKEGGRMGVKLGL